MRKEALKELENNPVDIIFFIRFLDVIWTLNEEDHCQQSIVKNNIYSHHVVDGYTKESK